MRSLFLRTFLLFWVTVLLAGTAMVMEVNRESAPPPGLRESLFNKLLPEEAAAAAQIFESSGAATLDRRLSELETRRPLQAFFYNREGEEVRGRTAPDTIRDMARLVILGDPSAVIGNVAGRRATGPSGQIYALVFLQEPGLRYR